MGITMIFAGVVKVPIDHIIDMTSMRDCLMAAAVSMDMSTVMTITMVLWCATSNILRGVIKAMLIYMIIVQMMQMTIMQVIDMAIVGNRTMATVISMNMDMLPMRITTHLNSPYNRHDVRLL